MTKPCLPASTGGHLVLTDDSRVEMVTLYQIHFYCLGSACVDNASKKIKVQIKMKIKIPRWVGYYAILLTEESLPEKFIDVFIFFSYFANP